MEKKNFIHTLGGDCEGWMEEGLSRCFFKKAAKMLGQMESFIQK